MTAAARSWGTTSEIDSRQWEDVCASTFNMSDSQTVLAAPATFTGLTGSRYCMQVRAINAEGDSDWVEAGVFSVMELTEPGEPGDVTGSSSVRGELTVTWSVPSSDGGSAILGYDVEVDDRSGQDSCSSRFDSSDDATVTSTSVTFTGLKGSAYCVRVRATNAEGDSDWVEAGVVTMAASAPGAPKSLDKSNKASNSITLKWEAPSSDGGSSITDYLVEYRESGSSRWITLDDQVGTATSAKVTGLSKGTKYEFRVAAVNGAGQGDYTDIFTQSTGN